MHYHNAKFSMLFVFALALAGCGKTASDCPQRPSDEQLQRAIFASNPPPSDTVFTVVNTVTNCKTVTIYYTEFSASWGVNPRTVQTAVIVAGDNGTWMLNGTPIN